MTRTTKAKTKKAKHPPGFDDPAIVAAKEAQEAAAAWSVYAKAHPTLADEQTPEYKAIKEQSEKADQDFSDAPVTSLAGALTKLRALAKDITEDRGPEGWDLGHVKTVAAFLEGLTGAPSVVADDHPDAALLALWQEYVRVMDRWKASPGTSDDEGDAFNEQASRIECQICDTMPHTPAGLVVLVKLLASFQELDPTFTDGRDGTLSRNILAALERLTPGLVEIGWGPVAAPDPAVVAGKEAKEAAAAFDAISASRAEPGAKFDAAQARTEKADAIFADAPVASVAGALAKMEEIRATVMSPTIDPDETYLDARHFKTVVIFLEGRMVAAEPDAVVTLFAKWAIIRDEATALSDSDPKGTDDEINRRWEDALRRLDAVEDQIMEIPATSMRGVAIKIRIASHYIIEAGDVDKRYATPSRDIDYAQASGGPLDANESYVISALRDAEQLAG